MTLNENLTNNVMDGQLEYDRPSQLSSHRDVWFYGKTGRVFFNDRELVNYRGMSARHIYLIYDRYRELLGKGAVDDAVKLELKHNYPRTWLESVLRDFLADSSRDWLIDLRKDIKTEVGKD